MGKWLGGVVAVVDWWIAGMQDAWPAFGRAWPRRRRRFLDASTGEWGYELEPGRALVSEPARASWDGEDWLGIPAALCASALFELPSAAIGHASALAAAEVERMVPFPPETVIYALKPAAHQPDPAVVKIELHACRRASIEAALGDAASRLPRGVAGVDVLGDDGIPYGINLCEPAQRRPKLSRAERQVFASVMFGCVALVAAGVVQTHRVHTRAGEVESEIQRNGSEARRLATLESTARTSAVLAQQVVEKSAAHIPAVGVIDDVARRLPRDTFLDGLERKGERVTLYGESPDATRLTSLMAAPIWTSTRFVGSLAPGEHLRDRFALRFDLRNPATDAPAP